MDPISDMFIRIKNAKRAGHETTLIPYSKFKYEIAQALTRVLYISGVEKKGKRIKRTLEIVLGEKGMRDVRLISKPGRRVYASAIALKQHARGGVLLLSTPKGVLTASEAVKNRVGGEILAEIW